MKKVHFYNFNKSEILFFNDSFKKIFPKNVFEYTQNDCSDCDAVIINCIKSDWSVLDTVSQFAEHEKQAVLFSVHEPDMFFLRNYIVSTNYILRSVICLFAQKVLMKLCCVQRLFQES